MKTVLRASFLILGLSTFPMTSQAHPHVFIDGGLGFVLDDRNRVTHLRVTWEFDLFYSLLVVTDEGLDADGDGYMNAEEGQKFAEYHSQWMDGFEGDSYLWAAGDPIKLSTPIEAKAETLADGRVRMVFLRALDQPVLASSGISAQAYDPSFYTAYSITEAPQVVGGEGCSATLVRLDLSEDLAALQTELAALDANSTPDDADVGALFADTIELSCAE